MRSRTVVLVTVARGDRKEDAVLASDVPIFQLLPALGSLVGSETGIASSASSSARWHLRHHGRTLAPTRTLSDVGIVDGEELLLSHGDS